MSIYALLILALFLWILHHLNTTIKPRPPMAKPYVVTSLKVDEELWKKAKKRAIDEEITLQELLNAAVLDYLRRKTPPDFRKRKHEN